MNVKKMCLKYGTLQKSTSRIRTGPKTANSWSHIGTAVWMRGCNKPEDKQGSCKGGAGEDVEKAEAEEGNDVLDVVEVGASDSLNILVRRSLGAY